MQANEVSAFCDESSTDGHVYCIAGYWATKATWDVFSEMWRDALSQWGLAEFHAADCEHRRGEFVGVNSDARRRLWRDLIQILKAPTLDLEGFFSVVDLRGWSQISKRMVELRAKAGLGHAHYVALQIALELISKAVDRLPAHQRVDVVFDQRPEPGKSKSLYDSLRGATEADLAFVRRRLGQVSYGDSRRVPQLQAADLLAYEVREQFIGIEYGNVQRRARWQWKALFDPNRIHGQHLPEARMQLLLRASEARFALEAEEHKLAKERRLSLRALRATAHRRDVGVISTSIGDSTSRTQDASSSADALDRSAEMRERP